MEGAIVVIDGKEYILKNTKCNQRKYLCDNWECLHCYNRSFVKNKMAKYFSPKNNISVRKIFPYSNKKHIFYCDECNHEFESKPNAISSASSWCPYCSNPPKKLCGDINCMKCFNKSFASDPRSISWTIEKNERSSPLTTFLYSGKSFWFSCNKCNHYYLQIISNITLDNSGCPYCANQKLCNSDSCKICFEKSLASHGCQKFWSYEKNGTVVPRQVFLGSSKIFWFCCNKCGHNLRQVPHLIASTGHLCCKYCCYPPKKLCDDDKCHFCFNNSFASHEKAKYWSNINEVSPRYVFKKSDSVKYLFNCNYCYVDFEAYPWHIFDGRWCNKCRFKTEKLVSDFLTNNNYLFIYQYCDIFEDQKSKMKFDFYISEYNIILEIDGPQHHCQISNWKSPEDTQKRDIFKMKRAIERGISVIRILQEEIWNNEIDWQGILKEYIKKYDTPRILYFANNPSIYDNHIKLYDDPNFKLNNVSNDPPEDHIKESGNDKINMDLSMILK